MQVFRAMRISAGFLFAGLMLSATPAFAQNYYPLEITNIKPAGTPPSGLNPNSRIYRAYPGLAYNIRAAVIGGSYPYQFTLSNAPAGMAVNPNTGDIIWSNPQNSATPTLTITDAGGASISTSWSINVTTTGFKFIDAVNGRNAANNGCSSACGTGTAASPWRTIKDMGLNASANDITYFKSGTYSVLDMTRNGVGGPWEAVEFSEQTRSVQWIAYPGTSPVIDFGYTGGTEFGPLIFLGGNTVYVDGFETRNSHIMGFQVGATTQGPTFRKLNMHHHGPGGSGTNASMIMTLQNYPNAAYGMVIQDSQLWDSPQVNVLKIYSQNKMLIEGNVFHDTHAGMELKADVRRFVVRANTFYNIRTNVYDAVAIGGNMHGISGTPDTPTTNGEICFNLVRDSDRLALNVNQDSEALTVYVYRNTFVGGVQVENTDASDGPFYFNNNIIVNNDSGTPSGSHITYTNVSAPSRITQTNNLVGSPSSGILDSAGNLTAAYQQYLGTRGYQLGSGGSTAPNPPAAPTAVRIIR